MNENSAYKENVLYIGELSPTVTESNIYDIFSKIGPVSSVRIPREKNSQRSLGYGYVNYYESENAKKALTTLNFARIENREIRVMYAEKDSSLRKSGRGNIFIKNLDPIIDNKTLYDTFSSFGEILSSKVATNIDGKSKGYGFVHFKTEESANTAIDSVNNMEIVGKLVEVSHFKPSNERHNGEPVFTNLYVKDFPETLFPNAESFKNFFAGYGEVTSAHFPVHEDGKTRGFGFVNFKDAVVAREIVQKLHKTKPHMLYVSQSLNKELRRSRLMHQYLRWKQNINETTAGRNVYVKNLPLNVSDEDFRQKFGEFGEVESAKISRDEKRVSKGFAFVLYRTVEDAENAIKSLHGSSFGDKVLYVALFQRQSVRKRQRDLEKKVHQSQQMMQMQNPQQFQPMMIPPHMMQQMMMQQMQPPHANNWQQVRAGSPRVQSARVPAQNRNLRPVSPQAPPRHAPRPVQPEKSTQQLRKEMGDRIYALVSRIDESRAAKVTGMFLEMDTKNLHYLLENPALFEQNVNKAIDLLDDEIE